MAAPTPPASLIRYLRERRCVLFAGSGLSAWARLPTWRGLLEEIINDIRAEEPDREDVKELNDLLAAGKFLDLADYCKERLGEHRYSQILTARLGGASGDVPEAHQIVARLPFSAVVTTNYDQLIERAYERSTGSRPKTPTHADNQVLGSLLFDGGFFVLKAHGDIDRPDTLVLTARDYRDIIHANPAFNAFFSAMLLTKAILFVGYSLNDPDFRLLLDRQLSTFKEMTPDRYALMSDVGSVERDILWRTAKVRVLPYKTVKGSHQQVLDFLRALEQKVADDEPQPTAAPPPAGPGPGSVVADRGAYEVRPVTPESGGRARPAVREAAPPVETQKSPPSAALSVRVRGGQLEVAVGLDGRTTLLTGPRPDWVQRLKLPSAERAFDFLSPDVLRRVGEALLGGLPEGVAGALAEVPASRAVSLRLSAETEPFPWEWLLVGGEFLAHRNPVVRATIGVSDRARGYPTVRPPVRVLAIGDPNGNLPGAETEARAVKQVYDSHAGTDCTLLVGREATFNRVVAELATGYDVVHFAGHAWFDAQESYIYLSDELRLGADQLRPLLGPRPPAILVLNSHYTSFVPLGMNLGDDGAAPSGAAKARRASARLGFTEVASATGVGAFVGCFGSPEDKAAQQMGATFHAELLRGATVADALHTARLTCAAAYKPLPASARRASPQAGSSSYDFASSLLYSLSGYGELTLPALPARNQSATKPPRTSAAKKSAAKKSPAKKSAAKKHRQ